MSYPKQRGVKKKRGYKYTTHLTLDGIRRIQNEIKWNCEKLIPLRIQREQCQTKADQRRVNKEIYNIAMRVQCLYRMLHGNDPSLMNQQLKELQEREEQQHLRKENEALKAELDKYRRLESNMK